MQKLRFHHDIFFVPLIILTTGIAFFCFSPYRVPDPHRDSGIFLNIGAEIVRGKVLYQQAWDIKQPLIYFIDALGLWLGRGSLWGVWGLELAFLLGTFLLGYALLRQKLPPFASFFGVAASLAAVFPLWGGNYTEEYTMLFQMGILAVLGLGYLPDRQRHSRALAAVGIGALAGLCFNVKQTYLDVAVSALALLVFLGWLQKDRRVFTHLLLAGLGFLLANLPFWLYFAFKGALSDYITGAFLYNRYYVSFGLLEWIHSLLEKLEFISTNPLLMLSSSIWLGTVFVALARGWKLIRVLPASPVTKWAALAAGGVCWLLFLIAQTRGSSQGMGLLEWLTVVAGAGFWIAALGLFLKKSSPGIPRAGNLADLRTELNGLDWSLPAPATLFFLGLLDLPIAVFAISLSGKDFTHYYISLFPAVFILLAAGLTYVIPLAARAARTGLLHMALAAVLVASSFAPLLQIYAFLSNPGQGDARSATAAYLKSVTQPGDKVLVWGWDAVIYFLADREPSTRYAIQFAAYQPSPYRQEILSTLLSDLQNSPPVYIADTVDPEMPLLEGRSGSTCRSGSQVEDPQLLEMISYMCSNYELDQTVEHIRIYKLRRPD